MSLEWLFLRWVGLSLLGVAWLFADAPHGPSRAPRPFTAARAAPCSSSSPRSRSAGCRSSSTGSAA